MKEIMTNHLLTIEAKDDYFDRETNRYYFNPKGFYYASEQTIITNEIDQREVNQVLINQLNEKIRKADENPKKYKLTLYNVDYEGIKVLKKPGWLREHYVAIPIVGKAD